MSFLAIDPGILTGWATVDAAGVVLGCGKGEGFPFGSSVAFSPRAAIIECPQVYRASKSKGDPNNLITLAVRVGRYQERLESRGIATQLVLPTTWKGQIDKHTHHLRTCRDLSAAERAIVEGVAKSPEARGYSEDVWDAVALAKWACKAGPFASYRNER